MASTITIQKLPLSQRLAFSIGHVLNDLTASVWFSYLLIYLIQVKAFSEISAGLLMLIGQISDALFTPFIGLGSDKTNGLCKMGKRKTWHLFGTLCLIGSYPFVFNKCIACENSDLLVRFFYYATFIVIAQFGWACVQINHLSLVPLLTADKRERVQLNGMRYAFTVISNLITFGVFWLLFNLYDENTNSSTLNPRDSDKFRNLVLITVAIGSVFCFIFHIIVQEKDACNLGNVEEKHIPAENSNTSTACIPIVMTWNSWLREIQFYQIGVIYMCARLFVNVSQIYLPLFITETLQMEKENVAVIPLVVYISGFLMSLLLKPINMKIGKKAIYLVGCVFGVAGCTWIHFLESSSSKQAYGVAILVGIGGSTMLVTVLAMTADLIGANTESCGFVYGSMSFTDKLSSGVVVVVIQHMHPCKTCTEYYRTILTFVPASAAIVASLCLLTLLSTKLGVRSKQASNDVNTLIDDIAVEMDEKNAQVEITKF